METIKFRAWDKRRKRMIEVTSINFRDGTIQEETRHAVNREVYLDDIVLMQYTGLKDQNGVEIYEGDILPSNYTVFSKGELKLQVVRFLDGGFRRLSVYQEWGYYGAYGKAEIEDWHDGRCLSEEEARKTKVLGNIYENPELLEEED